MKVLILADNFGAGGGAGAIARIMAERFSYNHTVSVLTVHAPQNFKPEHYTIQLFDLHYPPVLRNYLGVYHRKAIKKLKEYLKTNHPDVVITHNIHTNWSYYVLKVLHRAGIKVIHVFHDVSSFTPYAKLCNYRDYHYSWLQHLRVAKWRYNPIRNIMIRRYLKYAYKTVAVSHELKKALQVNSISVDEVIYNGVEDYKEMDSRLRGNDSEYSIFFGGRLSTSKGMMQVVEYLKTLKEEFHLTPALNIAAEIGEASQKMKTYAAELGVADQLNFRGYLDREQYYQELAGSSVVIVPSICFDSLPTIILEAMARGLPVVATNLGGAKEIIEHDVTGYIADPYDVKDFSKRISQLLQSQTLADQFGKAGHARFQQLFTADIMVKSYLQLL